MTIEMDFQSLPEIKDLVQELVGEFIWYIYALLAYEICKMPDISSPSCRLPTSPARGGCKSHLSVPMPVYQMVNPPTDACVGFVIVGSAVFVCDWDHFSGNCCKKRE